MKTKCLKLWEKLLDAPITNFHKDLGNSWKTCPVGQRVILEQRNPDDVTNLKPESLVLGYDFSISLSKTNSKRAKELLEIIDNADSLIKNHNSSYIIPSWNNTGLVGQVKVT